MPQFNHFETKSGQQIDPTFGLNALSEETKRKTKAREQMNIAANVIRQSLAADGKGLTKGTEVNIEEGGQYTFSGDNATKDETNLYNIRKANYGKTGTGTNVTSKANFAPEQAALAKQAQDEAAMAVPHNTLRGGGTLTSATAPTTPTTYPNLVQPLPVPPTPISPVTAGVLSGTPIPLNPLMAAAANLSPGTSLKSGQSKSENMSMTDSVSNNYQNLQEVTTTSDIEVRDQLNMNQSDLAVASAMEALNSQVYGTTNPGVYKGLMEQNSKTMQATNEALVNQKSGTTLNTLNQGSVNRSMSTSKGKDESKSAALGGSGSTSPKIQTKKLLSASGVAFDVNVTEDGKTADFTGGAANRALVKDPKSMQLYSNEGSDDNASVGKGNGRFDYVARLAGESPDDYDNDLESYATKYGRNSKEFKDYASKPPTANDEKLRVRIIRGNPRVFYGNQEVAEYAPANYATEISKNGDLVDLNTEAEAQKKMGKTPQVLSVTLKGKLPAKFAERLARHPLF